MMAGNAGSIPAEDMDVRVLCLMCFVQVAAFVASRSRVPVGYPLIKSQD